MKRKILGFGLLLVISLFANCGIDYPDYSIEVVEQETYLRDWLLCGPFPNCQECKTENYKHDERCKGFFTDYLTSIGGETGAIPAGGTLVEVPEHNLERRWFIHHSETDKIHLNDLFTPNDLVVAYAFCRIESPDARKVILTVGSNDGVRVWLNGKEVHEHHVSRWLVLDHDYVPIELKPGKNNLLFKIDDGTGDFGLAVRLLNYDSTLARIRRKLDAQTNLSMVAERDTLVVQFGQPYKIGTLNPGAPVHVELIHEKIGKFTEASKLPGMEMRFLIDEVPDGFILARATFATPEDGAITAEKRHFKGKLKRLPRVAGLSENLMPLDESGEPLFPIGTYGAPVEDYDLLKKAGYNFVVASAGNLDAVHAAGLKAAVPVHGKKPHWFSAVHDTIAKYRNHPAVLCWMLYDEPGYNRADLLDIYEVYKTARKADAVHPSYLVITTPSVYATFGRCCDVLAVDTYPISRGIIMEVGKNIAEALSISEGDQPIWHCGQLFAWPTDRVPTPVENRFMSYFALIEGARGILWYTFKWGDNYYLPASAPKLWEAHQKLLDELNKLAPVFMAPGYGEKVALKNPNPAIKTMLKKSPMGTFLIAANSSKQDSLKAHFIVKNAATSEVPVFGESRTLTVEKGILTDSFTPLSVHIYKLDE